MLPEVDEVDEVSQGQQGQGTTVHFRALELRGQARAQPRREGVSEGWGAGQLEDEISRNGWLTVGADHEVIFTAPAEQRYQRALALLGVDPMMLSQEAGHA